MIAVVDYGVSDIKLLVKALELLKTDFIVSSQEYDILKSEKVILPGKGEISVAIKQLHKNNLFTMLRVCRKPILGINTGMQIFADNVKGANVTGLGIFPGSIDRFKSEIASVPFKGLHNITLKNKSKLFKGILPGEKFYFNHTHYLSINIYTTSAAENNTSFSASVENGNYFGVQFQPEESGDAGLSVLKNFIEG